MTTILVIEDETPLRESIRDTLYFEGFDVLEAENGKVGLHLAQQHKPDLIICDIMMPELDGYGVLEALRNELTVPFLFLTAKVERDDIRKGMNMGADDYLTKPFSHDELLSAIRARLDRQGTIIKELEQAKQRLVKIVAHELRTPLVSISLVNDIISMKMDSLSGEELHRLQNMLGAGSRRLKHLVEQMVFITQIEAGAITRNSIRDKGATSRLDDVLTSALPLARRFTLRHADTKVRRDNRDTDIYIFCDPFALKHAVAELISNALEFSPEGSEVLITTWKEDQTVYVSILDQGPGIAQDELKQVVTYFQQINRENQEQQGMGIGYPLAQQLIEAHGGSVKLRSVVDVGTQVIISMPTVDPE